MPDQKAKKGQIFVCCACGKTSKTRYGDEGTGWDESCMLNAVLCYKDKLEYKEDGRVKNIKKGGVVKND